MSEHRKNIAILVPFLTRESLIEEAIRSHLRKIGFTEDEKGMLCPPSYSKESIRITHALQRKELLKKNREFISNSWKRLKHNFANGSDVVPNKISPELEMIKSGTWQCDLFRLASFTWSVPVSQGFGRRLRYLVWDNFNRKLMGIIALGDPVFNLKARDSWINWTLYQKKQNLVNVMDAYVLGALPPYNMLLGGKLIACLIRTEEIKNDFNKKYHNLKGLISGLNKRPELCLVTTTSALGRSSVYNRLKLENQIYFEDIGFTKGWGHFHIPDNIFEMMRNYLISIGDKYANNYKFGEGANWKLRAIKKVFSHLNIPFKLLKHGITREVFACTLAGNAKLVLCGKQKPHYSNLLTVEEVSGMAINRWILPRSKRNTEYLAWNVEDLFRCYQPLPYPNIQTRNTL